MNQEVVAVVAGEEITQAEFDAFLRSVPREQQAYLGNPQFRQHCLEQLIALHLYAKLGEDEKLEKSEEFQKMLDNAKRDILAQLAVKNVMKNVSVEDGELEKFYEENSEKFQKGETVNAKHILMDDEEKIKEVLAQIESGEKDFETAAKEFSTCPSSAKGGDLGTFGKGQMVKEFEDAAFSAEIGTVTGPVKTQFGYHLILVAQKNEAAKASFEEVKESIRQNLMQQKQNNAYESKLAELREKYVEK